MSAISRSTPVVGIDLGGTKILAGVVGPDHQILGRAKRPTPARDGGDAILRAMIEAVDEALSASGLGRDQVAAAAVGSPGPLDSESGVILFSSNMNVKNYPLGPKLSEALALPVLLQNDVRVGGYGEYRLGAGRGHRDVLAAFVGTGIGGFVVVNGQVLAGYTGNAGEVGHVMVKYNGPKCGCGRRGCMESLASRTAINRRVERAIRRGQPTSLAEKLSKRGGRIKSGDLSDALAAGDQVATKEIERAAKFLGLGLGSLVNVLGPEVVIIGGGVAEALGDPYVAVVERALRYQALTDPDHRVKVSRATLGDDAGILGASLLAREKFLPAEA